MSNAYLIPRTYQTAIQKL